MSSEEMPERILKELLIFGGIIEEVPRVITREVSKRFA